MAKTRIWQEGDTWPKVAYLETFDSRNFRKLLRLNPSFDIRTHPAPGIPILVQSSVGIKNKGKGTLNQLDLSFDLRSGSQNSNVNVEIFPWDSLEKFTNRLTEYTAASILQADRVNGYSLDSPQALRAPRK